MNLNILNRLRITKKAVAAAIKYKKAPKGSPPPYLVQKIPNLRVKSGKLYSGQHELIPKENRAKTLKLFVYGKGSSKPFGRDSLFFALKNTTAGIPRRFVQEYIRQQPILSASESKPKRIVRQNTASIRSPMFWACDLVHVRVKDVPDFYLGEPDDGQSEAADRYFLTVVNLLTSYTYIRFTKRKLASHVAVQMRSIVKDAKKKFARSGGIKIMASDDGKEFRGEVAKIFQENGITHKVLKLSPHVESRNAYVQSVFYRVVQMKRGKLKSAMQQTQKIVNSTLHRKLKITPNQAVKQLLEGTKVARSDYKPVTKQPNKGPKKPFPVGTLVRKVKHAREKETKLGYKRYRGQHFTLKVYTITKVRMQTGYPRYDLSDNGGRAWHDELLRARKSDVVDLPLIKTPERRKPVKQPAAPTRRSRRQRGKRVDYAKYY